MFPECLLSTLFFAIFAIVIAIMKDVPDIEGDTLYKISTFSVRIGGAKVFRYNSSFHTLSLSLFVCKQCPSFFNSFAWSLLAVLLSSSSLLAVYTLRLPLIAGSSLQTASKAALAICLSLLAFDVRRRALEVESKKSEGAKVFSYYMYVWNIFYGCYLLLPLAKM